MFSSTFCRVDHGATPIAIRQLFDCQSVECQNIGSQNVEKTLKMWNSFDSPPPEPPPTGDSSLEMLDLD
jgi:hypothetical protein